MKITTMDTNLILTLMRLKEASTTALTKLLFDPIDDYELRKIDNNLRYRLERMRKKELLRKNGVSYSVNEERVFLTKASMRLVDINVEMSMGEMLVIYPKGEEIMMTSLNVNQKNSTKISEKPL